jgi:type I restriction enzyme S subunit
MIADLKPYADYKETGLLWLGKVPRHWEIKRGKSYLTIVDERSREGREELLTVSSARGVVPRRTASVTMFKAKSYAGHKLCWPGDLVINSLWAWGGGLGVSRHHGIISTAYSVYRSRPSSGMDPRFLHELVRSAAFQWELQVRSKGVWISRLQLTDTAFLDAPIPLPPPDEQAAIVRFLDWANGRLERAIRAKRKVIALLNEQKQAIIHRAVTRGLDPSIPLKPSGIPWLGDIPSHWEVRRIKSLCRFVTSGSRGWARYYADAGFVFLRIGNISTTSVDLRLGRITYVTPPAGAEGERTRAIPDDLLLSITAQIGAVGVVPEGLGEAFVNQHTALIRLRQGESVPRWVAYGLLSRFGKDQCRLMTNGGTKIGLTLDDVRCLVVLLPPMDEQAAIVSGIEGQTDDLDIATSRLEREIDLLREYRTCLVADVVTGKRDVREAAARLPDDEPVPEAAGTGDPGDDLATDEEADA